LSSRYCCIMGVWEESAMGRIEGKAKFVANAMRVLAVGRSPST
jgi:hypothetical protein